MSNESGQRIESDKGEMAPEATAFVDSSRVSPVAGSGIEITLDGLASKAKFIQSDKQKSFVDVLSTIAGKKGFPNTMTISINDISSALTKKSQPPTASGSDSAQLVDNSNGKSGEESQSQE